MSGNIYFFIAIVPSVVLHEVSHGFVANYFGDPTAKEHHRLTLNPLRHIDPFGTIILPALLIFAHFPVFGYAKPVPVNFSRLRKPRQQSLYVSLVGPLVNILLAVIAYGVGKFALHINSVGLLNVGYYFGLVNLMLAAFNLLPIPPLDGSAIIERLVPNKNLPAYYRFRQMALPLVFALVILDSYAFHVGSHALTGLQNWWLNRLLF